MEPSGHDQQGNVSLPWNFLLVSFYHIENARLITILTDNNHMRFSISRLPKTFFTAVTLLTISHTMAYAQSSKPVGVQDKLEELVLENFSDKRTTANERRKFFDETVSGKIEGAFAQESRHLENLGAETIDEKFPYDRKLAELLGGAFWNAGIINYLPDTPEGRNVHLSILRGFDYYQHHSTYYKLILMRSAHALYSNSPQLISNKIKKNLEFIDEPKTFAAGVSFLMRYEPGKHEIPALLKQMKEQFPDWETTPQLYALVKDYEYYAGLAGPRPPLQDLLRAPIMEGRPVIFSFQRQDRRYPGIAVVRKPDGKFVRTDQSGIFNIPHLAMSRTNMPGTVTFGNSPRGIFSVKGTGKATNQFIGPTPYLWSRVPIEANVGDYFFGGKEGIKFTEDLYRDMLPDSWKDYDPIYEAFWAGQAGRSEMITHGTTINPEFYFEETYYPQTPSAGCLCAYEKWDHETGNLVYSDQLALVRAFLSTGQENGALVVVELDNKKQPISMNEVLPDLVAAESN